MVDIRVAMVVVEVAMVAMVKVVVGEVTSIREVVVIEEMKVGGVCVQVCKTLSVFGYDRCALFHTAGGHGGSSYRSYGGPVRSNYHQGSSTYHPYHR